jgi:hypothetical protein
VIDDDIVALVPCIWTALTVKKVDQPNTYAAAAKNKMALARNNLRVFI